MDFERLKKKLLSKETRKRLYKFVAMKVSDHEDVEEIVQETLLSAFYSLPTFKGNSQLFSWICSIARHEVADFYRKKKIKKILFSRFPFLKTLVSEALGPELAYQELEVKRKILKTLGFLGEGNSQVLRLKYIEGLSVKEIAQNLGTTAKAVESRLTRARFAFEKIYVKENQEIEQTLEAMGIVDN